MRGFGVRRNQRTEKRDGFLAHIVKGLMEKFAFGPQTPVLQNVDGFVSVGGPKKALGELWNKQSQANLFTYLLTYCYGMF